MPHGTQRLRPVQDRHRAFELAHRGPDARRAAVRAAAARRGLLERVARITRDAVRLARRHRQGPRQRQGHPAGPRGSRAGQRRRERHRGDRRSASATRTSCRCWASSASRSTRRADLVFNHKDTLPLHSNGMQFTAFDGGGAEVAERHLLLGGRRLRGQRRTRSQVAAPKSASCPISPPLPFRFAAAMSCWRSASARTRPSPASCGATSAAWRSDAEIDAGLLRIWHVMQACVKRGCETPGRAAGRIQGEAPRAGAVPATDRAADGGAARSA